jgi:pimeloyl-ACP methyl ester carboxylesterase
MPSSATIIYFHGIPGSAAELSLFGPECAEAASNFQVLPRTIEVSDSHRYYWDCLASSLKERFPGEPLKLVGFSLGAAAALRLAAILKDQVAEIALISPAAPLELGDYTDTMAGASVFLSAQKWPSVFALQCRLQSVLARVSAPTLARLLFASAQDADRQLWQDPSFREGVATILRQSIGARRADYEREIRLYVEGWAPLLAQIEQPVSIDHGEMDNWSPVAMAHDLARNLPNCSQLTVHPHLSHYSTLQAWLKQLFA